MKNFSFCILILLISAASYSQKLLTPEFQSFNGRFFSNPLPSLGNQTATSFYFDRFGFLWVGTYSGLYRYDGTDYIPFGYSGADSMGFDGHIVTDIYEDPAGNLWFGTSGALNCLNIKTGFFTKYYPESQDHFSPENMIRNFIPVADTALWIITGGDLYSFRLATKLFTRYKIENTATPLGDIPYNRKKGQILKDTCGSIWFATRNGLYLHKNDNSSLRIFKHSPEDTNSISSNKISFITHDSKNRLWIATEDNGLNLLLDPDKGLFRKIELNTRKEYSGRFDSINTLLSDYNGSLWIFGDRIFGELNSEADQFKSYFIMSSPSHDTRVKNLVITKAFQLSESTIFFHSEPGWFMKFDKDDEKLSAYKVPSWFNFNIIPDYTGSFWFSVPSDNILRLVLSPLPFQVKKIVNSGGADLTDQNNIAQGTDGSVWLSLSSGLVKDTSFDPDEEFRTNIVKFNHGDSIASSILIDHDGNLWLNENNGPLLRIERGTGKVMKHFLPGGKTIHVHKMAEDRNYNLWLTDNHYFYRVSPGSDLIVHEGFLDKPLNLNSQQLILDFIIDSENKIWIGKYDNGVWVGDLASKAIRHFTTAGSESVSSGDICCRIRSDSAGKKWLLFESSGLYYFDSKSETLVHQVTGESRFQGLYYLDLLVDRNDNVRVISSEGMSVYDPSTGKERIIRFNPILDNFNSFQLSSGDILAVNDRNLYYFPETIPENHLAPEIYITSLKLNNLEFARIHPESEEIRKLNSVRLNYKQNNLLIGFSAINFLEERYGRYKYKMSGVDEDTINSDGNFRFAEYRNMRPGKFSFWVTGSDNVGNWNPVGKNLEIIISPPWYKSILAYIIYTIFFTALIYSLFRLRLYQLNRDKRILEGEIRSRTAELQKKNEYIEELDRTKTRFFTEISHEIRTPLSLISGPIENLILEYDSLEDEKRIKLMSMIKRNSKKLLNLVNQLLEISRLDSGNVKIRLVELDILKCLRILVYEYLSLAESRKIKFVIEIPDGEFITYFDRDKTEKLVSNLLSNAFKFTPSWGIVRCRIEICNSPLATLLVSIRDSGAGISSSNLNKIFDRFYRIEGQWEKDGTGTGIGLSITKEYVTLLHGKIKVTSEPGVGSEFEVKIPLGTEHYAQDEFVILTESAGEPDEIVLAADHTEHIADNGDAHSGKEESLLLIEDNDDLRTFIRGNLSQAYHILESENGKNGLNIALSKIPDLIISDIILPDIDGVEICKRLKNDERTSHIPIILLTAKTTTDDKIEGLKSGADDYIFKPFDINELKARVFNLISLRDKLRSKYGMLTGIEQSEKPGLTIDERFINKVTSVILESINDFDFDVGTLQEKIGMSRVHLYRKIKAMTGLSPSILIRNIRIKKAASLIKEGSDNVAGVSFSVGFSNPSYFSKCFRKYYGVSPADFKNEFFRNKKS